MAEPLSLPKPFFQEHQQNTMIKQTKVSGKYFDHEQGDGLRVTETQLEDDLDDVFSQYAQRYEYESDDGMNLSSIPAPMPLSDYSLSSHLQPT